MDHQLTAHPANAQPQTSVFLKPGQYFVGNHLYQIRTVLGSCVSMTLWDPHRRVGAMSHFVLADRRGNKSTDEADELDGRYGDEALRLMLRELARQGVIANQCQAKIFGGGDMFPTKKINGALAIGRRNGEAARQLLRANGIQLLSENLFGEGHRQIIFDINSGDVWVRQVPPNTDFNEMNCRP